jgi:type VI secretion system secreted protein VgrG
VEQSCLAVVNLEELMATEPYTQAHRDMKIVTPLPADFLLLTGLSASETISQLFHFDLDVVVENTKLDQVLQHDPVFDKVLGQRVAVELVLPNGNLRHFHGLCHLISQGERDVTFTPYRLEVVPDLWRLSKRLRSRIFQQITVPDLLKKLLKDEWQLDVTGFGNLQGQFEPRDYVVQYRETDFNFVSRLMEEEGIFYFFKHSAAGHQMILANTSTSCPPVPAPSTIKYDNYSGAFALRYREGRIYDWRKLQELRSGKCVLWDHCFELPHRHLEAEKMTQEEVQAGQTKHKLKIGDNVNLTLTDWPGKYAQRFDGVTRAGGDQSGQLQKIWQDNQRTVGLRMQEETASGIVISGASFCRQFAPGQTFTLQGHVSGDGTYLITSVSHSANNAWYRSGGDASLDYTNTFVCLPVGLPYRPPRTTRRPVVPGTQTAVVVGPQGEEVFTDKYGRVKVQFHWDAEGQHNQESSCWVRVGQVWAGKRWGASFWPRVGQEVVVDFVEGDPDQPIIIGSVYNAGQMPPYLGDGLDPKHKNDNKVSGIKSNTTMGGQGFNEWRFDDTKGKEQVFIHAERNLDTRVKNDCMELVLHDRHLIVGDENDGKTTGDQKEKVFQDKHLHVKRHQQEHVEGDLKLLVGHGDAADGGHVDIVIEKTQKQLIEEDSHLHVKKGQYILVNGSLSQAVGGDQAESVGGKAHLQVKGDRNEKIGGDQSLNVAGKLQQKVGGNHAVDAGQQIHLKAGVTLILEAGSQLSLKVGGNFIDIGPAGVSIQGTMVMINSGGAPGSGSGCSPSDPTGPAQAQDAQQAKPAEPAVADDAKSGYKSAP